MTVDIENSQELIPPYIKTTITVSAARKALLCVANHRDYLIWISTFFCLLGLTGTGRQMCTLVCFLQYKKRIPASSY